MIKLPFETEYKISMFKILKRVFNTTKNIKEEINPWGKKNMEKATVRF